MHWNTQCTSVLQTLCKDGVKLCWYQLALRGPSSVDGIPDCCLNLCRHSRLVAVGIGAWVLLSVGCWVQGAAQYETANLKRETQWPSSGRGWALVPMATSRDWWRAIYTVSWKKVNHYIHFHNFGKQCRILAKFYNNNATSNCKQNTKFR